MLRGLGPGPAPPLSISAQLAVPTKVSLCAQHSGPRDGLSTSPAAPSQSPGLALLLPEPLHPAESLLSPIWAGSLVVLSSVRAQVLSRCGPRGDPYLLDPPLSSKPLSPTLSSTPPLGCPNIRPGPHSPGLWVPPAGLPGHILKPQGVLHAAARGAPLCSAAGRGGASHPLKIEARVLTMAHETPDSISAPRW